MLRIFLSFQPMEFAYCIDLHRAARLPKPFATKTRPGTSAWLWTMANHLALTKPGLHCLRELETTPKQTIQIPQIYANICTYMEIYGNMVMQCYTQHCVTSCNIYILHSSKSDQSLGGLGCQVAVVCRCLGVLEMEDSEGFI